MKVTQEELQMFTPANNYVLLKPAVKVNTIKYGDLVLHNPIPWDEFKHQPIVCQVVAVPKRLIYGKRKEHRESVEELEIPIAEKVKLYQSRREALFSETTEIDVPIPGSMMWKTPMELKPGDIVWVGSNALLTADNTGDTIIADGFLHYFIKYSEIYLKKDGDNVKMLNGWVLAELVDGTKDWVKQAKAMGLTLINNPKSQEEDNIGVIRYIGSPVEYLFNDQHDHPEIKQGDYVRFLWKRNRRLEPGEKFFAKDNADLIVTRRSRIMAIMQN